MKVIKKLPSYENLKLAFPLPENLRLKIAQDRQEVKNILSGKDQRLLVIVGPCSAWPYNAVLTYAEKLSKVQQKLNEKIKVVMRTYVQKPRTSAGWTGPLHQPDPFAEPDIEEGLKYSRSLMLKVLEMGLPIGDEALFTQNAEGFLELLSWVAIGARSTEDQEHRIFASAIDVAVGMKNPTGGSIEIGVYGVSAAQNPHTSMMNGNQIQTSGNPYAHLVLRGGIDRPNYYPGDIYFTRKYLEKYKISNPSIIIDASHDNCKINGVKKSIQQIKVAREVLANFKLYPEMRKLVKGFMFESFLKSGAQKIETLCSTTVDREGLSVTDPCLSWSQTENLLLEIAGEIK